MYLYHIYTHLIYNQRPNYNQFLYKTLLLLLNPCVRHVKPDTLKRLDDDVVVLLGVEGEIASQELLQILGSADIILYDHLHHRLPEVPLRVNGGFDHRQALRQVPSLPRIRHALPRAGQPRRVRPELDPAGGRARRSPTVLARLRPV